MDDPSSHEPPDHAARSNGHSTTSGGGSDPAGTHRAPAAGPIYSARFKVVMIVAVVASVAALAAVYAGSSESDRDGPTASPETATSDSTVSPGIRALHPTEGSQVLQQETVRVDLAPGWDGTLTINGQTVPEDDLTRSSPTQTVDRLELVPGPGKVLELLPSGRVCVRVQVWQRARGPETGSDTREWCFQVV